MSTHQDQNTLSIEEQKWDGIDTQQKLFQMMAEELAAKSEKWRYLFELAARYDADSWLVVSFIYSFESGGELSQPHFVFARVAKLLATTEDFRVDERLITKQDLVNWNRQAILAMIEAEKQSGSNEERIERGYKTIELINALFPEFLIEDKKSSPFPKW